MLSIEDVLTNKMMEIVKNVKSWVEKVTILSDSRGITRLKEPLKPSDIFIGYTEETIASLVYKLCKENYKDNILADVYDPLWYDLLHFISNLQTLHL